MCLLVMYLLLRSLVSKDVLKTRKEVRIFYTVDTG